MPNVDEFLEESVKSGGLPKIKNSRSSRHSNASSMIKSRKSDMQADVKSVNSLRSRRKTVSGGSDMHSSHKGRNFEDDEISGVLNTITAEDVKYRDLQIDSKSHPKKLRVQQARDLQKLDEYDVHSVFKQTLGP
jgi:hypothetical protein